VIYKSVIFRDWLRYIPTGSLWGSLNTVCKYVSSPTTRNKVYLSRISIYKVVDKAKNKGIRVRRRIIRVSGV
jgi:hypothetical protein